MKKFKFESPAFEQAKKEVSETYNKITIKSYPVRFIRKGEIIKIYRYVNR